MLRSAAVAVALFALPGLVACGDDDDQTAKQTAAAGAGNVQRYCTLSRELDEAGSQFFARLERENASPKDFEAAERRFIERFAAKLEEVKRVAPRQIKADLRTLFATMRQRAGLPAVEVGEAEASKAEKRMGAFEKRSCG